MHPRAKIIGVFLEQERYIDMFFGLFMCVEQANGFSMWVEHPRAKILGTLLEQEHHADMCFCGLSMCVEQTDGLSMCIEVRK